MTGTDSSGQPACSRGFQHRAKVPGDDSNGHLLVVHSLVHLKRRKGLSAPSTCAGHLTQRVSYVLSDLTT